MKILFSGGGTLGPVTPLLGFKDLFEQRKDLEYIWVGTKNGPEKKIISEAGIPFFILPSGKFRRYFSFKNIWDIFVIIFAFFRSIFFLLKHKPNICITAGGFNSVPIHFAAFFLGIPTWVHQLDREVGLANKLMAKIAKVISVSNEEDIKNFKKEKAQHLGNIIRKAVLTGNKEKGREFFHIQKSSKILLVTGGGTGSESINNTLLEILPNLEGLCEVIHLTGKGKFDSNIKKAEEKYNFYHPHEFLTSEMKHAVALSDIIVSRAGFGSLTEFAAAGKPCIIIPLRGQQEENVLALQEKNAIVAISPDDFHAKNLEEAIERLFEDLEHQESLRNNFSKALPQAKGKNALQILDSVL